MKSAKKTKTEQALTRYCTRCGAAGGQPCTFQWPTGVNPRSIRHAAGVQSLIDKVGTPTIRPHNERYTAVLTKPTKKATRRWEHVGCPTCGAKVGDPCRSKPHGQEMWSGHQSRARLARGLHGTTVKAFYADWDRAIEYDKLRTWFLLFGGMFEEA